MVVSSSTRSCNTLYMFVYSDISTAIKKNAGVGMELDINVDVHHLTTNTEMDDAHTSTVNDASTGMVNDAGTTSKHATWYQCWHSSSDHLPTDGLCSYQHGKWCQYRHGKWCWYHVYAWNLTSMLTFFIWPPTYRWMMLIPAQQMMPVQAW